MQQTRTYCGGLVLSETKDITTKSYENITDKDTLKFFRRLGGTETAVRCYTPMGYCIVKLTSKSQKENKL
jgi:hypothetical protein